MGSYEYSHSFPAKFLIFSDRVITENWTKPAGHNPVTLDNLETHPKNPMIARVFKELGWVEELGSGRKNIKKYAPYYYLDYRIMIENEEKFIFSMTYRNADDNVNDNVRPLNDNVNNRKTLEYQSDKIRILIGDNVNDNVKERLFTIINSLYSQPKLNRIDLIEQTKIKNPTIDRYIKILKDANIIEFIGSDKTGGYYLTQEAKEKLH